MVKTRFTMAVKVYMPLTAFREQSDGRNIMGWFWGFFGGTGGGIAGSRA
jgi:hypothetical protein